MERQGLTGSGSRLLCKLGALNLTSRTQVKVERKPTPESPLTSIHAHKHTQWQNPKPDLYSEFWAIY